ncbi:hypothetical protein FA95DRAFT_889652 [Auriscalpium vulgare]|uniref:Uncharacterized protein n=1 Tax=Auriscalpium vulgare TaxID=40419 RepID=A0ACB8RZJ2_9AGAM|nr:hypothetical protein FA95DRAFT_889652 [Auriscalpium vulgare]
MTGAAPGIGEIRTWSESHVRIISLVKMMVELPADQADRMGVCRRFQHIPARMVHPRGAVDPLTTADGCATGTNERGRGSTVRGGLGLQGRARWGQFWRGRRPPNFDRWFCYRESRYRSATLGVPIIRPLRSRPVSGLLRWASDWIRLGLSRLLSERLPPRVPFPRLLSSLQCAAGR